jgi:hypothetical protein
MPRQAFAPPACFMLVVALFALSADDAVAQSAPTAPAPAAAPAAADGQTLIVLRLNDNTLLVGHVVREDAETVVFSAGALGELTLKTSEIAGRLDPATVAAAFQAPAAPAPPPSALGTFAPPGQIVWTRTLAVTGNHLSSPFVQGNLDPRFPALTGKALRLQGGLYQVQSQVSLARTSGHDIVSLDASYSYAFADNVGKQADNPRVSLGYNHRIGNVDRLYTLARYTWLRDGIKKIDYSNQTILGIGIKTIDTPRIKLDLVPVLALQYDKKGTPFDNDFLLGVGAMEVFQVTVGAFSQIEQKLTVYRSFNESRYYGLESTLGFKGMVTKAIGFTISWAVSLDNSLGLRASPIPADTLFPGQAEFTVLANERTQSYLTSGLLIRF